MRRATLRYPLADLPGWALMDTRTLGGLIRFLSDIGSASWVDVDDLTFHNEGTQRGDVV